MATVRPFRVDIGEDVIQDLRDRIARTRWPDEAPGPRWSQGTDPDMGDNDLNAQERRAARCALRPTQCGVS